MTTYAMCGFVRYFQGDLEGARGDLEMSCSLYDFQECGSFAQLFGDDPAVGCLGFLGRVVWLLECPERGCAHGHAGIALARRVGHPHVIATALALAIHLEAWRENDSAVSVLTEELASIGRSQSFALWSIVAKFFSAWLRCRTGDASALDELSAALVQYDDFGAVPDRATYAVLLAEAFERLGRHETSRQIAEQALAIPPRVPVWDERLVRLTSRQTPLRSEPQRVQFSWSKR